MVVLYRAVACLETFQQRMPLLQIYEGEVEPWLMSDYCTDTVPVLLRRATFCRAFAADAKDFRSYNSWVRTLITLQQLPLCTNCAWELLWSPFAFSGAATSGLR